MNEQEKVQQNMISNLPLLFANGYPTSLEKITESQLENFIPFMVQCSLGHINSPKKTDCSEPEWWPEDITFTIPLTKPKNLVGNWIEKMKEIVVICYQFHKSLFLLRFCNDLASYEQASLRFINNYNSTTSLYDRRSNKLLVTFRNENMSYDQQQRTRKCLLQQKASNGCHEKDDLQDMMVEPAPFDIYLCDNCDAELYSKEAIMEHEKTCNIEDIILCDSPEPEMDSDCKTTESDELRKAFLMNFNLQSRLSSNHHQTIPKIATHPQTDDTSKGPTQRTKRFSRRNRAVHSLTRCPSIPLTSPAGVQLLRTTKVSLNDDYLTERLDRVERFCQTPLISKINVKSKNYEKRLCQNNMQCTFKRPNDYSSHIFVFPRRQHSQRRHTAQHFMFLNSPLIKQCRPIAVRLKKIAENAANTIDPIQRTTETTSNKLNIRLTRDTSQNSNWRISPSTEVIIDTIDLCSSDEEDEQYSSIPVKSKSVKSKTSLSSVHHRAEPLFESLQNNSNDAESCLTLKANTGNTRSLVNVVPAINEKEQISGNRLSFNKLNMLLPSSITVTRNPSDDKSLKPLRQSVYIFSNYKTNSALNRYSVDPLPSVTTAAASTSVENTNHVECNQENCSLPKNQLITVADLYSGNTSTIKSVRQGHDINYDNLSVAVTPFTSPGRIVSIDLTT